MDATGSTKVLYATELEPLVKPLQAMAPSTEFQAVPSFQQMLDGDGDTSAYPYGKTFEEARNDPIVVLHSSGSTGKKITDLESCEIRNADHILHKACPSPSQLLMGPLLPMIMTTISPPRPAARSKIPPSSPYKARTVACISSCPSSMYVDE